MVEKEKIIIFIDGSNHYNLLKDLFNNSKSLKDFNFEFFIKEFVGDRTLVRAYYYTAPLDWNKDKEPYKKQQKFLER